MRLSGLIKVHSCSHTMPSKLQNIRCLAEDVFILLYYDINLLKDQRKKNPPMVKKATNVFLLAFLYSYLISNYSRKYINKDFYIHCYQYAKVFFLIREII